MASQPDLWDKPPLPLLGTTSGFNNAAIVGAKPFVPSAAPIPQLAASASTGSLRAAANAAPFVPGGAGGGRLPGGVGAKPFMPAAASASRQAEQPGADNTPVSTPVRNHRVATPDLGLPDGDDLLGLSTGTPVTGKDVVAQAAEMFNAMKPFPQPGVAPPPGIGPPPGTGLAAFPAAAVVPGGMGRGRGASLSPGQQQRQYQQRPPPPPTLYPTVPPTARGGGSSVRGGGRGRRGGGGGPGSNRPTVAAYALSPGRMQAAGRFMPESLRQEMQQRSYLAASQLEPEALAEAGLPPTVQQYHSLYPLEDPGTAAEAPSATLGVRSLVIKGVHSGDGGAYALRRLDGRQLVPTAELLAAAEATVERWASVANHPNVVGLREAFVSDEVDATPAFFLAYDYHPGAVSLEQAHVLPAHSPQGLVRPPPVTEEQLWSYLVQLTAALRAVHKAGLALRSPALAPSKVLLSAPGRVRLGAPGLLDALAGAPPADLTRAQREDLSALGALLLRLACAAVAPAAPLSLDLLPQRFSRELCHLVAGLLAARDGAGFADWGALAAALGDRVLAELEASATQADSLAAELQKECESGRLARLLVKLAMVNERPELGGDSTWAETGDRYLLKLFRDFVFHQVDESGAPVVDWGGILEALNKADAGVQEKVLLLSRDGASMLVVSYEDVRRCIQAAYAELQAAAAKAGGGGQAAGRQFL